MSESGSSSHSKPLLWIVIGPNGAGKSTYFEQRIRPRLRVELVNADEIGAERWPDAQSERAYEAAALAAERRAELISARRSFATETVFSHPSKLDLLASARSAGYEIMVTFVLVASAGLARARVASRVEVGGHAVPDDKIVARYERMRPLAVRAVKMADRAFVVDNTDPRRPLRDVLLFERGEPTWRAADLPGWVADLFPEP